MMPHQTHGVVVRQIAEDFVHLPDNIRKMILEGVDYVFSAAALKQVPSCEFYPMEAVRTNVIGSDNVITACVRNNVKKAIFLSTDKAAYPINAMGISKALMEKNVILWCYVIENRYFC